ncbi:histidine phosphatase family protein [Sporosarcina ureilytica]|uniref:Histidine phosphatase family protein n=1 Tax=Sporosarcina ureilytica TaxID=298596 RepID=A0A1D8JG93_9BACL|nr:histidine phosphatase family protein [Sporosarcina ureilytica]AOV07745.1 histidine phosphatase family protein [Sporosarcina ureilytica]
MKKIYLVRHCEAQGQSSDAELTENGLKQAASLVDFFSGINIDRIISSPFKRAVQSIIPLTKQLDVEIEFDNRLTERMLSSKNLPDWMDKLSATFKDFELKFEGGESSREAMNRIVDVVEDVFNGKDENTIIVTHGNLLSLLLNHYNKNFGFDEWQNLSNPDVFLLKSTDGEIAYERLWELL